jgi:hypothetical protein
MIHLLKPQDIGCEKIRLGPNVGGPHNHCDGGYVCSDFMITKSTCLVTYGVGGDTRYEQDYAVKFKKPVYMFDPFVDHPAKQEPNISFEKVGLGFNNALVNDIPSKDFTNHYKELNLNGDVLLKIDIEGGEYDYFSNANISEIASRTTGIILELHNLAEPEFRDKAALFLEKLREYYVITHIHANNWGSTFDYIDRSKPGSKFVGYVIPRVVELTFANKRFIHKIVPDTQKYPIEGLDFPNNANIPDCDLDFLNDF